MRERALSRRRQRYLPLLFAVLGIVFFVNLFSGIDYRSFALVVNLSMDLGSRGLTRILLPPIGEIRAATHRLPVRLNLEVRSVNLAFLRSIVFSMPQTLTPLRVELEREVRHLLVVFALKLVALGVAGSIFALIVLGVRELKQLVWAAVTGAAVIVFLLGALFFSYDLQAFERIEYEGIIEAAPWALNLAWEAADKVGELGERVRVLAGNLYSALERLEDLGQVGLADTDLVALHISDVHNNPVAYRFVKQVIENFPVDLVLDTGDLTDWGTALEAEVAAHIEQLQLPYIFVSGNHESPEVLQRLAAIPNVIIINGRIETVLGLEIAGAKDWAAEKLLPEPASLEELARQAQDLNAFWEAVERRPQIFMVHNHRLAREMQPGLFQVVACGHSHRAAIEQKGGTVYINAGTTGAAGIRGFQSSEPVPYSLALLYFVRKDGEPVLKAVDSVFITGLGTSFSLQRTFVEHSRNPVSDVEIIR